MAHALRPEDIAQDRLRNQQLVRPSYDKPGDVVRWFGAVQAQDYLEALWGVGLRTRGALQRDVERAIAEREIVRTWPLRGTIHFVAPNDVKWMLAHFAPRVVSAAASRYRELELDAAVFSRVAKACTRVLQGGQIITRAELYAALEAAGVRTTESRGMHIMWYLAHRGLVCYGPRAGKQPTFTLLDEWVPNTSVLTREEALAELALRYFQSHGPATVHDFAWWAGIPLRDARSGVDSIKSKLGNDGVYWFTAAPRRGRRAPASGTTHLLPVLDEYVVAYRDRSAVFDAVRLKQVNAGGGMIKPVVVIDGRVVGTWKRVLRNTNVLITVAPFSRMSASHRLLVTTAAARYGTFLQLPTEVVFTPMAPR